LYDVDQFVIQQLFSGNSLGLVLSRSKYYVPAYGIRERIHGPCGLRSAGVDVDADPAEIMSEAWFEESARRGIQRLAGRA
jgi:hypothetical protein